MDAPTLTTILTTLVGAGVIGLFRLSRQVTQLDTAIRGVNGDNGIVGTVKELRAAKHEQGDKLHALTGRITMVEHDVAELREARP